MLGLILSVKVIKIAEELIEAVNRGQELVAVAKMVLAELPGRVTQRLEQFGERRSYPIALLWLPAIQP